MRKELNRHTQKKASLSAIISILKHDIIMNDSSIKLVKKTQHAVKMIFSNDQMNHFSKVVINNVN